MSKKILVIAGPTAVGKTSVAIDIAQKIGGEIVSADSMQIYKGLDIGTAKPTPKEQKAVRHRMIDICSPEHSFSVADYVSMAEKEIENIFSKGLLPIVVGGTGLYIDNLIYKNDFGDCRFDPCVRKKINERAECEGGAVLLKELSDVDPETASRLHENDIRRIVRALEIFYTTGKTQSSFIKESRNSSSPYDVLYVVLTTSDREVLYNRINKRVDIMMNDGLLLEAERVVKSSWYNNSTASQAIGYKEFVPYFENSKPLDECVSLLKQHSRNYAKRQLTWFRKKEALFICVDKEDSISEKIIDMLAFKGD